MSFVQRNSNNCIATIPTMIGTCLAGIPSKCFLSATTKNSEELPKAYSMKIHCRNPMGKIHSKVAMMQQVLEYPYVEINYVKRGLTIGRERGLPIHLNAKYSKMGTPKPKEQTITKAQRTSASSKKQPFHIQSSLNLDSIQFEKFPTVPSRKMIVAWIQSGPYRSGFGVIISMKSSLKGGMTAALTRVSTSSSVTLKYSLQQSNVKNLVQTLFSSYFGGSSLMFIFQWSLMRGAFAIWGLGSIWQVRGG